MRVQERCPNLSRLESKQIFHNAFRHQVSNYIGVYTSVNTQFT